MNFYGLNWYATPGFLTVVASVIILYLTRSRKPRTYLVQIYRLVVIAMGAHNLNQLTLFIFANNSLPGALSMNLTYYSLSVLTMALLTHLALTLVTEFENNPRRRYYTLLLYTPAVLVMVLLWTTKWMITGYLPTGGVMPGVAFNSLHGPGYIFLVGTVLAYLFSAAMVLLAGTRSSNQQRRLRAYIVLFSSTGLYIYVSAAILQLLRVMPHSPWLNVTFAGPTAMFIFLMGTGYAIYRHRLLDLEFYIPWSKERRIKSAFYKRIQLVSERIPRLQSPEEAMRHISEVLRCPVVVRTPSETIMTPSPISRRMAEIPMEEFARYDNLVAVDEMASTNPPLAELMRKHKVFAAVPVPQGAGPDSVVIWVLLGEELSETIYSSRDFAMVSLLFNRMEIVFINQLGDVRREMNEMRQSLNSLQSTCNTLVEQLSVLTSRQPGDLIKVVEGNVKKILSTQETEIALRLQKPASGLLYLGRDRALFDGLRKAFPQIRRLSGPGSQALTRDPVPAVIIYDQTGVLKPEEDKLVATLRAAVHPVICYVYGRNAKDFVERHKSTLPDVSINLLPDDPTAELIVEEMRRNHGTPDSSSGPQHLRLEEIVANFEKRVIEMALSHMNGNRVMAARLLDITPVTLYRKMTRHNIVITSAQNKFLTGAQPQ